MACRKTETGSLRCFSAVFLERATLFQLASL
jgi:hypothetical protein